MDAQNGQDPIVPMDSLLAPLLRQLGERPGQAEADLSQWQGPVPEAEAPPPLPSGEQSWAGQQGPAADHPVEAASQPGFLEGMQEPLLQELLLRRLESGQIHRHEMQEFQSHNQEETIGRELMWIVYAIDLLETHRFRLVNHLRTLRQGP